MSAISPTEPFQPPIPGVNTCGIRVHPYTWEQVCRLVFDATPERKVLVGTLNLHGVYLAHKLPEMLAFFNEDATFNYADGAPIVLFSRLLGEKVSMDHYVTLVEYFDSFMEQARDRKIRIFYLGSKPGVAETMAENMRAKFPGLDILTRHGYFDSKSEAESLKVIEEVNAAQAHVVMVGLGQPLQEIWLHRYGRHFTAPVVWTTGASADYPAGAIPQPPAWMGRYGLFWLFRLFSEPRRLWSRYLVEPWVALFWFVRFGRRLRVPG